MRSIADIGTVLGPDVLAECRALLDGEQQALAAAVPAAAENQAYGPHERHKLDLYGVPDGSAPVVLFVHGGGFRMGDKASDGWDNAAVGRWAARQGWLGAVMNYRLAPESQWPAGGEDVLAAVDWLSANAARFEGDPDRIVLIGTSAGAVHVATALQLRADLAVRGCVLLSGLYGYTPLEERDTLYYGEAAQYTARMPREAVAETSIPLMLACAQFDPSRFLQEWIGLLQERLGRHGKLPFCHYANGHNHYSMAMHLGTSDHRLADEIAQFIRACCA